MSALSSLPPTAEFNGLHCISVAVALCTRPIPFTESMRIRNRVRNRRSDKYGSFALCKICILPRLRGARMCTS
jgi:hypothetical protein